MTGLLVLTNDFVLLGNHRLAGCVFGDQNAIVDIQETFTRHPVEGGACLLGFEQVIEYQGY
jgi:hypothetical protein